MMLLFSQYKNIILFSAIGILVLLLAIQSYRINSYKADLAQSTAQVTILSASIESQNNSINKLSQDSLKRTQEAQEALNKANLANGINEKKIMALKSQIGKFKSCDDAANYSKGLM